MDPVITQDRFLVTHSAFPGLVFRTSSGVGGERTVTKRRRTPGGGQENVTGRQSLKDITVTIGYDRTTDQKIAQPALRGATFPGSITRQALDLDDTPIPGAVTTFVDVALKDYSIPDSDVDAGDPGDITLVFSVGKVA